jgi:hypothetical protein
MKKMNGHVLEIEPGTCGEGRINNAEFNAALNAWARRRGIDWGSPFRKPFDLTNRNKNEKTHHPKP